MRWNYSCNKNDRRRLRRSCTKELLKIRKEITDCIVSYFKEREMVHFTMVDKGVVWRHYMWIKNIDSIVDMKKIQKKKKMERKERRDSYRKICDWFGNTIHYEN